jgi:type I restriction enzyme R subunit
LQFGSKWKPLRQALDKKDRKIFDEMFSYSRLYNSAGSMACKPVLIHPILISIIFEHYKQLRKIENGHPLIKTGQRDCQVEAIKNLEKSFTNNRPRSLIQMATGSGKTFTAVSFVYRLIKFAKAKRILFLVDRRTLAGQTFREFQNYETPDDGRKFTELYNVQPLSSRTIDPVSKVVITTIQRLYSILGNEGFDEETEDISLFDVGPALENQKPKEVTYNTKIPIETL